MSPDQEKKSAKKKLAYLIIGSLIVLAVISTTGIFILSKIKSAAPTASAGTQEQFAGQAETSQELQAECQKSAVSVSKNENLQQAVDEFKKHVENCREVYFTGEEKTKFRNEGMYPDLAIDLLAFLNAENKTTALDFLAYLKTVTPWQFYMGPIVCDSKNIIAAYEESIKPAQEKICVKNADFKTLVFNELKNKNFEVLDRTLMQGSVAWLGSPESDAGCPEKISNIIKTTKQVTEGAVDVKESETVTETKETSVVFRNKSDEDKLVLEFDEVNGCIQLKAALVAGFAVE